MLNRNDRARIAADTVAILEAGHYTSASGKPVSIRDAQAAAVAGTVLIRPDDALPDGAAAIDDTHQPRLRVICTTTFSAARELAAAGRHVVALNFASAKNPGGGFLGGARAQEEDLAMRSGLFGCINGSPMYAHNRRANDPLYSHHMIWSPRVPVFRDDDTGALLDEPWPCSIITAPAVNAGNVRERHPQVASQIEPTMRERAHRVLAVAHAHGGRGNDAPALVLGAWGCGVFRNDPAVVATIFRDLLIADGAAWRGVFADITFAVLDPAMCDVFARIIPATA
ncbi:MAG: TIGR02452 family protein [Planctomycetota bacterium]